MGKIRDDEAEGLKNQIKIIEESCQQ